VKTRLENFALIAEIVAAAAVVVSLLFVGMQLRENTAAVRANSSQQSFDSSREFLLNIALDEDLSRIRQAGSADPSSLTPLEYQRYNLVEYGNLIYYQSIWIQWTLGAVDDRAWQHYKRLLCNGFTGPGTRLVWERAKFILDPEFVRMAEEECAN
jgi:hypothetical protein